MTAKDGLAGPSMGYGNKVCHRWSSWTSRGRTIGGMTGHL